MSEDLDKGALPVPVEDGELVNAAPAGELEQPRRTTLPVVQAAAAAAGGFVAGAAVVGLVHRRHARALARGRTGRSLQGRRRATSLAAEGLQIVGSRSLLLDVHLLGSPSADR